MSKIEAADANTNGNLANVDDEIMNDPAYALQRMQLALDAGRTGIWDWNLITGEVHLDRRMKIMGYERGDACDFRYVP